MASTEVTVIVGSKSWCATARSTRPNSEGRRRKQSAVSRVAAMHEVPEAANQLKLNTAWYGAGRETMGGIRRITSCRRGHLNDMVLDSSAARMGVHPHNRTQITRKTKGSQ